jgi:hypothetical protein
MQACRDFVEDTMDVFSCFCCSQCKPRYKRLVDAIYPRNLADGPVWSNMQKLTFYAMSHPEKLNRIGIYIVHRLSRDLYRQRYSMVEVAVEAMDQVLKVCHASSSLQQFFESYLKMVQKLLETNDPHLEKLATDLFLAFASICEDSPSYHRQYDFFISKFSSMCHAFRGEHTKSQKFNGLRGLRGVIKKSAGNDIQVSIWEKQHMDKIVPSILFNLPDKSEEENAIYSACDNEEMNEDDPSALAVQVLRELMEKSSFGSLRAVLEPVMSHLDSHKKWDPPPTFAINTFFIIIYSIQTQNAYFVIQELINHLENMTNANPSVRVGIATVLQRIVSKSGTSIGPLVLGIFHSLLKRLRVSVEFQQSRHCPSVDEEKEFQKTLMEAMGDFANALPDYQKIEIMLLTASNIPIITQEERKVKTSDEILQKVLVKTLLKVATKYKTFYFTTLFSEAFLKTLLQICLAPNSDVRLNGLKVLHTLFDRHDNLKQLSHLLYIHDVEDLQLTIEKCPRQDLVFMHRQIPYITSVLFRVVCLADESNDSKLQDHLDAVLCTMCLLCVEVGHDETLTELFRLAFGLQAFVVDTKDCRFSMKKRAEIHNLVARFLNLSAQLLALPALRQHVTQVINLRAQKGHPRLNIISSAAPLKDPLRTLSNGKAPIAHMESEDDITTRPLGIENDPSLLFDLEDVSEALKSSNKDITRLLIPFKPTSIPGVSTVAVDDLIGIKDLTSKQGSDMPPLIIGSSPSVIFSASDEADIFDRRDEVQVLDDEILSLSSSSIEWTPPTSEVNSRRNTLFGNHHNHPDHKMSEYKGQITLDNVRAELSQPFDMGEEDRKDQAKSREIVQMFRERPLDELSAMLVKDLEETDLNKTIESLCKKNNEWAKIQEFGSVGKTKTIFDIKFPSIVK